MMMDDKFILTVMEKFNASTISELNIEEGNLRLLLRKGSVGGGASGESSGAAAQAVLEEAPVHLGMAASPVRAADGEHVTSPIVATFYASPSPDSPPFVTKGSKIKAGQTLCILEAMKMMNHLEAEFDCEIKESHVNSGELVEYGQILFTVKKL
jgi:acetyl-CoA carboxylase biotin carboxyl carrier protein